MKPIRWGMIGCGAVTELKSAPAYQKTTGFELAAVMGRNQAKVTDYAQRHGVAQTYTDAEALIHHPDIDAIYIATPPDSHKHYGLMVAQSGKPCCIEKPLAPCLADGEAIIEAFDAASAPLFVAYYRRSLPRFNQVKTVIEQGLIGTPRHISWHLSKAPNTLDLQRADNWRTNKEVAVGGYFDDLASHGLDLFSYLLGDYQQVKGICTNQQGLYSAFDAISAAWLHKSGVTGVGSWNFGCKGRKDDVFIYGSEGILSFSVFDHQPIVLENPQGQQQWQIEHPPHIQQFHVDNMQKTLTGHVEHPSTGKTALHTAWVMEQILV